MEPIRYSEAVKVAHDLIGPECLEQGLASEYTRGAVELLADCFGVPGVFLADRKDEVLADLRAGGTHHKDTERKPLVLCSGGVVQDTYPGIGDPTTIDWDDWNDSDTDQAHRQEMIERIQSAGYRCIVSEGTGSIPDIHVFTPEEKYDSYINDEVDGAFVVYDPDPAGEAPKPEFQTVYVVGFAPNFQGSAATGGFDWYYSSQEAIARLKASVSPLAGHDYTIRALPVPYFSKCDEEAREAITEYINNNINLIELPIPADVRTVSR